MNDIVISLLVILGTVVLTGSLFLFLTYRKRQKDTRLIQAARERGWELKQIRQPRLSGFILKGKTAHGDWLLESLAETSSASSEPNTSRVFHRTHWRCQDISLLDRAIVIGPLPKGFDPGLLQSFNTPLLQLGMRKMFGEDADWITGLSQITLDNKNLASQFLCLATEEQDARRLLSPEVEKILIGLPQKHKPVIKFRSAGLEVSLPTVKLSEPSELDAMIQLGRTILAAWQG